VLPGSVSQQRLDEAEAQTRQLSALIDSQTDGFVTFNPAGFACFASPAFCRLTGADPAKLQGLDETGFSNWLTQRCNAGVPFSGLSTLRLRGAADKTYAGEVLEISLPEKKRFRVQRLSSTSPAVSFIVSLRDVSHEQGTGLTTSQLLSRVVHDLRTPLASIAGFTDVLQTQTFDETSQREFLAIIAEQTQLMVSFMDQLLDLSRLESRQGQDFLFAPVFVQELVAEVVQNYPLPAQRERPEILSAQAPILVMADAARLRQVIGIVLSNAFAFSPAGGAVTVRLERLTRTPRTPEVAIHISDTGMGMTLAQTQRVFDPLYRVDTSGKTPGTGLGLSVAKAIMALHHGEIQITSTPQQGTCVSLLLPTKMTPASKAQ